MRRATHSMIKSHQEQQSWKNDTDKRLRVLNSPGRVWNVQSDMYHTKEVSVPGSTPQNRKENALAKLPVIHPDGDGAQQYVLRRSCRNTDKTKELSSRTGKRSIGLHVNHKTRKKARMAPNRENHPGKETAQEEFLKTFGLVLKSAAVCLMQEKKNHCAVELDCQILSVSDSDRQVLPSDNYYTKLCMKHDAVKGKKNLNLSLDSDHSNESEDNEHRCKSADLYKPLPKRTTPCSLLSLDLVSPLGQKVIRFMKGDLMKPPLVDIEQYCANVPATDETACRLRQRPCDFDRNKQKNLSVSNHCHVYKFKKKRVRKRQLVQKPKSGLSTISKNLQQQMKKCTVSLTRLSERKISEWRDRKRTFINQHLTIGHDISSTHITEHASSGSKTHEPFEQTPTYGSTHCTPAEYRASKTGILESLPKHQRPCPKSRRKQADLETNSDEEVVIELICFPLQTNQETLEVCQNKQSNKNQTENNQTDSTIMSNEISSVVMPMRNEPSNANAVVSQTFQNTPSVQGVMQNIAVAQTQSMPYMGHTSVVQDSSKAQRAVSPLKCTCNVNCSSVQKTPKRWHEPAVQTAIRMGYHSATQATPELGHRAAAHDAVYPPHVVGHTPGEHSSVEGQHSVTRPFIMGQTSAVQAASIIEQSPVIQQASVIGGTDVVPPSLEGQAQTPRPALEGHHVGHQPSLVVHTLQPTPVMGQTPGVQPTAMTGQTPGVQVTSSLGTYSGKPIDLVEQTPTGQSVQPKSAVRQVPVAHPALVGYNLVEPVPAAEQNPVQTVPVAGHNPVKTVPVAGHNPAGIQTVLVAGQNPVQTVPVAGRNPVKTVPVAGHNPTGIQTVLVAGHNPVQTGPVAGNNPVQTVPVAGHNPIGIQTVPVAGQNPVQTVPVAGHNPVQTVHVAGHNPVLTVHVAGHNPVQTVPVVGHTPVQTVPVARHNPTGIQTVPVAGHNPVQTVHVAGHVPVQTVRVAGHNPVQTVPVVGHTPVQAIPVVGPNPVQTVPVVGHNHVGLQPVPVIDHNPVQSALVGCNQAQPFSVVNSVQPAMAGNTPMQPGSVEGQHPIQPVSADVNPSVLGQISNTQPPCVGRQTPVLPPVLTGHTGAIQPASAMVHSPALQPAPVAIHSPQAQTPVLGHNSGTHATVMGNNPARQPCLNVGQSSDIQPNGTARHTFDTTHIAGKNPALQQTAELGRQPDHVLRYSAAVHPTPAVGNSVVVQQTSTLGHSPEDPIVIGNGPDTQSDALVGYTPAAQPSPAVGQLYSAHSVSTTVQNSVAQPASVVQLAAGAQPAAVDVCTPDVHLAVTGQTLPIVRHSAGTQSSYYTNITNSRDGNTVLAQNALVAISSIGVQATSSLQNSSFSQKTASSLTASIVCNISHEQLMSDSAGLYTTACAQGSSSDVSTASSSHTSLGVPHVEQAFPQPRTCAQIVTNLQTQNRHITQSRTPTTQSPTIDKNTVCATQNNIQLHHVSLQNLSSLQSMQNTSSVPHGRPSSNQSINQPESAVYSQSIGNVQNIAAQTQDTIRPQTISQMQTKVYSQNTQNIAQTQNAIQPQKIAQTQNTIQPHAQSTIRSQNTVNMPSIPLSQNTIQMPFSGSTLQQRSVPVHISPTTHRSHLQNPSFGQNLTNMQNTSFKHHTTPVLQTIPHVQGTTNMQTAVHLQNATHGPPLTNASLAQVQNVGVSQAGMQKLQQIVVSCSGTVSDEDSPAELQKKLSVFNLTPKRRCTPIQQVRSEHVTPSSISSADVTSAPEIRIDAVYGAADLSDQDLAASLGLEQSQAVQSPVQEPVNSQPHNNQSIGRLPPNQRPLPTPLPFQRTPQQLKGPRHYPNISYTLQGQNVHHQRNIRPSSHMQHNNMHSRPRLPLGYSTRAPLRPPRACLPSSDVRPSVPQTVVDDDDCVEVICLDDD